MARLQTWPTLPASAILPGRAKKSQAVEESSPMLRHSLLSIAFIGLLSVHPCRAADAPLGPDGKPESKCIKLVNVDSGKVLALDGDSEDDSAQAVVAKDAANPARQWKVQSDGAFLKLVNRKSGKVLDVSDASSDEGGIVIQWGDKTGIDGESTDNQRWKWQGTGDARRLECKLSGLVLDLDSQGFLVQQKANPNSKTQLWRLVEVPVYYKLVNVGSGKILGVADDSDANEAQAMLMSDVPSSDKHSKNRQWKLEKDGNFVKLANRASDKVLDVYQELSDDGTQIILYDDKAGNNAESTDNQRWSLDGDAKDAATGRRIKSKLSGLVLDVQPDGSVVQRRANQNAKGQLWRVVEVVE
jgi:hypothetical protein